MTLSKSSLVLLLTALNGVAIASPAPIPDPVAVAEPEITPFRVLQAPTRTHERRDILSKLEGGVTSVLSALGSGIPSYVASG
jgi:hypothetical protein